MSDRLMLNMCHHVHASDRLIDWRGDGQGCPPVTTQNLFKPGLVYLYIAKWIADQPSSSSSLRRPFPTVVTRARSPLP